MAQYTISGQPTITATRHEVPIPSPGLNDVLIKVIATDSNPKDWKASQSHDVAHGINQGDDIAGTIHRVGSNVYEYASGDRVAAFHRMFTPHGSYAEYAITPASTTFKLTPTISFEEGATMPLAVMTAALALYQHLGLPVPWVTNSEAMNTPVLIFRGASAVGSFALKVAKHLGLNPTTTVAGKASTSSNSSTQQHIIDYRAGNVVANILAALDGRTLGHAFNAISSKGSGHIDMVDPPSSNPFTTTSESPKDWSFPTNVTFSRTFVRSAYGTAHLYRSEAEAKKDEDFEYVFYRYMGKVLAEAN
ncbi:GroES-like protein [Setomelanomma holmii]|uniref:GroES-like protein n=1 Tax=Setomelanomma holmii TaxID=210430 RepID=A0A9P4H2B2_9PLEO|nr:GroES-like protein [Setomelanomma holmii]